MENDKLWKIPTKVKKVKSPVLHYIMENRQRKYDYVN